MENAVVIRDKHLYITYQYYDNGHRTDRKIIPIEDVECIEATFGPRGGLHLWYLKGYHPEYSNLDYNKKEKRNQELFVGDRKDYHILQQVRDLLPNVEYREETESGGAPW